MRISSIFVISCVFVMVIVSGCTFPGFNTNTSEKQLNTQQNISSYKQASNLTVHFIDVGQGDSALLEYNGQAMLIDAGETGKGVLVENLLKKDNITSLDYVVATHPHEDHIGGMSTIIKDFPISHFVSNGEPHVTQTYTNMLLSISNKSIPLLVPVRGDKLNFGDPGLNIEILSPGRIYFMDDSVNQNSIVLKVTDHNVSFLFMGDAGDEAERNAISNGGNVTADILKVGHHGSKTASSQSFIDAVKPHTAVVSVGANNTYGLPDQEVITRIQGVSQLYRTDINGTITVTTDGNTYSTITEK